MSLACETVAQCSGQRVLQERREDFSIVAFRPRRFITAHHVGYSEDLTKREFAETITDAVGFASADESDRSEAKEPLRKLIDRSRLRALSWMPQKNLRQGLRTIAALVESIELNGQ